METSDLNKVATNPESVVKETAQEGLNPETPPSVTNLSPVKITPLMKGLLVFLAILLSLIVVITYVKSRSVGPTTTTATPIPSAASQLSPIIRPISQFAQTETFKNFAQHLTDLTQNQETLDLTESQLAFPLLEMNVNFNK